MYDHSNGIWSSIYSLSVGRYNLAATWVGSLALFAGGNIASSGPSKVVDIFNSTDNSWTTTSLSNARYSLAATSIAGKAFFAGGSNRTSSYINEVEIYDSSTGNWIQTIMKTSHSEFAATSLDNIAYFAGGSGSTTTVDFSCQQDVDCDDQFFCQIDYCNTFICAQKPRCQSDTVCSSLCNETAQNCFAPKSFLCETDDIYCNGNEVCDGQGECLSAGNPCPTSECYSCSESQHQCLISPIGSNCNDGNVCNGVDYCDATGSCKPGETNATKGTSCAAGGTCDGEGQCISSSHSPSSSNNNTVLIAVLVPVLFVVVFAGIVGGYFFYSRRRNSGSGISPYAESIQLSPIAAKTLKDVKILEVNHNDLFNVLYW
jgi:hypothetical protein